MIAAGMDAVRLNLSHGTIDEALATHRRVRKIAKEMGAPIGTLVDLPGPKIRAGSFGRDGVLLEGGARVRLAPGNEASNTEIIHVDYADLLTDLEVGDRISLGDGGIDLEVVDAHPDHLVAQSTAAAVAAHPDPEGIPRRNIARLEALDAEARRRLRDG